jgi:hypothetical protein
VPRPQIEKMSDFDDEIGEAYLMASDGDGSFGPEVAGLTPTQLKSALRRITSTHVGKALILTCGSAYKNKVRNFLAHSFIHQHVLVDSHTHTHLIFPGHPTTSGRCRCILAVANRRKTDPWDHREIQRLC